MNLLTIFIKLLLIQAAAIFFAGCSAQIDTNQKPVIKIIYTVEDLKVTLSGSITDADETTSKVIIDWGDSKIKEFVGDFSNIKQSHIYSEPGIYSILITASDLHGNTTDQTLSVAVNFKEVSLDNIKESMFKTSEGEYLILTVNLNTYQQDHQSEKFNMLTEVIGRMDIDFIALQECAQHKSATITEGIIREDNMALIISNRLSEKFNAGYNFVWNWAHYGWNVWEEGVAILSKHILIDSDDRYISSNTSPYSIRSRKVIYGSYQVPEGIINIFSAHTHWRRTETDEEQNNQIGNIQFMVNEKEALTSNAVTFVCGDFNGNPTSDYPWSEGYNTMMLNNIYLDTFLEIYPDANNKPAQSIYNTVGGRFPGRIDYIFMKNNAHFRVVDSQIIFTKDVVGRISDHYGVLTKVAFIQ